MLNDEGDGQTTLTYDNIQSANFRRPQKKTPGPARAGSSPCSFYWGPDYRTVTDMDVRKALAYAYPYQEVGSAGGEIVGVTRVPARNLMPPGIPGRTEYNPLPDHEPGRPTPTRPSSCCRTPARHGLPGQVPVLAGRPGYRWTPRTPSSRA